MSHEHILHDTGYVNMIYTSLPSSVFWWDPMAGNNVHFPIALAFVRSSQSQIIDLFSLATAPMIIPIYRDAERLCIAVKLGNERN